VFILSYYSLRMVELKKVTAVTCCLTLCENGNFPVFWYLIVESSCVINKFFKWPLFWHLKSRLVSMFYLLGSVRQSYAILKVNLECFVKCNVSSKCIDEFNK
jgi:hypothetical protein